MNTLLTFLVYFALGSALIFIVGVGIQTLQSRGKSKDTHARPSQKRKGDKFREHAQ